MDSITVTQGHTSTIHILHTSDSQRLCWNLTLLRALL